MEAWKGTFRIQGLGFRIKGLDLKYKVQVFGFLGFQSGLRVCGLRSLEFRM